MPNNKCTPIVGHIDQRSFLLTDKDNKVKRIGYCVADGAINMKHYLFKNVEDAYNLFLQLTHKENSPLKNYPGLIKQIETYGRIHEIRGEWGAKRYTQLPEAFKLDTIYLMRITKEQDEILSKSLENDLGNDPPHNDGSATAFHNRL